MSESSLFREDYSGQAETLQVDEAASVVRNVKILGWKSKNRRNYIPAGVNEKLYEGAFVNVDHFAEAHQSNPPGGLPAGRVPSRSLTSRFARLAGVKKQADGLYAETVSCNPSHPYTSQFLWWAKNHPDAVVFSHVAEGPKRMEKDGSCTVLSIQKLHSVDVVGSGGTNATLFENHDPMNDDLKTQVGEYVTGLFPEATIDEIKTKVAAALATPAEFSGDVNAALSELRTSKDPRVVLLVEAYDERLAKEATEAKRAKANAACRTAKLPAEATTTLFVESLVERDESEWAKFIEDRKIGLQVSKQPVSGAPVSAKPNADEFVKNFRKAH